MKSAILPLPASAIRFGQIALAAMILAVLLSIIDTRELFRVLTGENPEWLLMAVVILVLQTILSAWRWQLVAAELGQRFSVPHAVREYFMSQIFNQTVPGGVVGDVARAARARGDGGLAISGAAVALERLAGQIAMFLTLACALAATHLLGSDLDWPAGVQETVFILIAVGLLMLGAIGVLHRKRTIVDLPLGRALDRAIKALCAPHVLPIQLALGVMITLCNIAAFGFCALAVGLSLSLAGLMVLVPLVLFSMLIPLTISGWGIREGAAAALLPIAGASLEASVAASLMFGLAILLAAAPGLAVMVKR